MHTWSSRCLQTPWKLRACCSRSSRSCGSCISKSWAPECGNGPRAHQTHARLSRAHDFGAERGVRRRRSSVGTLVLDANTKEHSSQLPSTTRQRRRVRRATSIPLRRLFRQNITREAEAAATGLTSGAHRSALVRHFSTLKALTGLPKLLRLSYWSVVGRFDSIRFDSP